MSDQIECPHGRPMPGEAHCDKCLIASLRARLAAAEQQIADLDQFVTAALEDRDHYERVAQEAEQDRDRYREANEAVQVFQGAMTALEQERDRLKTENEFHANAHANWRHKFEALLTEHDKAQEERDRLRSELQTAAEYTQRGMERAAEIASLREALGAKEREWRCFQCGDVFTTEDAAREHFSDGHERPGCVDPLRADETARLKELREARELARKWKHEAEEADNDRALLASYQSEIGRLFGKCGGLPASTPHQAWLKLEAMLGRAEAAEQRVRELTGALAKHESQCADCGHVEADHDDGGGHCWIDVEGDEGSIRCPCQRFKSLPSTQPPQPQSATPRCACHLEQGDSPCPVHGDEECFDCGVVYVKANGHRCEKQPQSEPAPCDGECFCGDPCINSADHKGVCICDSHARSEPAPKEEPKP